MKDGAQASETKRSPTWHGAPPPAPRRLGPADWGRIARRGLPLAATVFGGLGVLLLVRLAERPISGARRPVSPWITRGVCRAALWWLGMRRTLRGRPMCQPGAAVANHASWLDIFALNAADDVVFVAKAEVAGWPGIGWLARATGTLFVRRDRADAAAQTRLFAARLAAGQRLLFFPEGTSSDGQRVLPFKPTLLVAFFAPDMKDDAHVQRGGMLDRHGHVIQQPIGHERTIARQTDPGMQHETTDMVGGEVGNLSADFVGRKVVVPEPERREGELGRRVNKVVGQGGHGRGMLPAVGRSCRCLSAAPCAIALIDALSLDTPNSGG